MRIISYNEKTRSEVQCLDEPGDGGASYEYQVVKIGSLNLTSAYIKFQHGSPKDRGPNGCCIEDILTILIDRLKCFKTGKLSSRETAIALTKIEEALMWLQKRTKERADRGVEGTFEQ